ncbi:MAG: hypothetical protein ACK53Y_03095, partial [bacterium]
MRGATSEITIIPVEPIGFELSEAALLQIAPKEWLLEKAGIDVSKFVPTVANNATTEQVQAEVNDNLKNLSGRQYQQVMRVIRQFSQGKITKEIATTMLKAGLGMTDSDINAMLGIDDDHSTDDFQFSALDEDTVIGMFSECGEPKAGYNIIASKAVFSAREAFA